MFFDNKIYLKTYDLIARKDDIQSNKRALIVIPPVSVKSATISTGDVVITGTGFGDEPSDLYADWLCVTLEHTNKKGTVPLERSVVSWSDTMILVRCPEAGAGDTATVRSLYGSDSVQLSYNESPKPRPTKKPK